MVLLLQICKKILIYLTNKGYLSILQSLFNQPFKQKNN